MHMPFSQSTTSPNTASNSLPLLPPACAQHTKAMHTVCVDSTTTTTLVTQLALQHMYTLLRLPSHPAGQYTPPPRQPKRVSANQPVPCDVTTGVISAPACCSARDPTSQVNAPSAPPSLKSEIFLTTRSLPVVNLLISIPPTTLSRPLLHLPRLPLSLLLLLTICCRRRQRQTHAAAILIIPPW